MYGASATSFRPFTCFRIMQTEMERKSGEREGGRGREIERDSAMWPDAKAIRDLLYTAGYKVAQSRHLVGLFCTYERRKACRHCLLSALKRHNATKCTFLESESVLLAIYVHIQ